MREQSMREQEETLFREWDDGNNPFVPDGVVNEAAYKESPQRLLFVLKEANADVDFDLRDFVEKGATGLTWNNITRWVKAIRGLPEEVPWGELQWIDQQCRIDTLKSIAAMNIKKQPGGAQADWQRLNSAVERDKEFIRRQIDIYSPDYIVCCGTAEWVAPILHDYAEENWQQTTRGIPYIRSRDCWLIDYWHPQQRAIPDRLLCYALVDAVREISE